LFFSCLPFFSFFIFIDKRTVNGRTVCVPLTRTDCFCQEIKKRKGKKSRSMPLHDHHHQEEEEEETRKNKSTRK
jgi:hypothetical protein